MTIYEFSCEAARRDLKRAIFWVALSFGALLVLQPEVRAAQAATSGAPARQEVVGRLSGDDVSVNDAISFETENGRTTAVLASGSDLTLRSGQAKIDLPEGGDIILCGPAHLSILKSGSAITIALDYGEVHLQTGATAQLTLYTPLWIVTPVAIADRGRDLTVGLDKKGKLCIMALSGAVRIVEQFTGRSLIVPQGGDIQIEGEELRAPQSGSRTCSCDLLVSQNDARRQEEARVPAHPSPNRPDDARAPELMNSPTYRIDMPPLTFDAYSAAPAPALTPEAVLLIRESLADAPIFFRGAVRPVLPPPPAVASRRNSRSHNAKLRFFARLFGIFHHHGLPASEQSAAAQP
jgi:hypothetical protein